MNKKNNKVSKKAVKKIKLNFKKNKPKPKDKIIIANINIPIKLNETSYQYLYKKSTENNIPVSQILSLLINAIPGIIELEFEG